MTSNFLLNYIWDLNLYHIIIIKLFSHNMWTKLKNGWIIAWLLQVIFSISYHHELHEWHWRHLVEVLPVLPGLPASYMLQGRARTASSPLCYHTLRPWGTSKISPTTHQSKTQNTVPTACSTYTTLLLYDIWDFLLKQKHQTLEMRNNCLPVYYIKLNLSNSPIEGS